MRVWQYGLISALVLATGPLVARTLVLRSEGPSKGLYPPGKVIRDPLNIVLKPGDRLTLMDGKGTTLLKGPARISGRMSSALSSDRYALISALTRSRGRQSRKAAVAFLLDGPGRLPALAATRSFASSAAHTRTGAARSSPAAPAAAATSHPATEMAQLDAAQSARVAVDERAEAEAMARSLEETRIRAEAETAARSADEMRRQTEPSAGSILVVRSSGPSAAQYPPGMVVFDPSDIDLKLGDSLTLLDGPGTTVLKGPMRASSEAPPPGLWDIDPAEGETWCVERGNAAALYRRTARELLSLAISLDGGEAVPLEWPKGQRLLPLPSALGEGRWDVKWSMPGTLASQTFPLVVRMIDPAASDPAKLAAAFDAQGCAVQLARLAEIFGPET